VRDAIREGVSRAWLPIRDSNLTGLLSAIILYWFGTSSVQGFALMLFIGILISMFSAVIVTRVFLLAVAVDSDKVWYRRLFLSGFMRHE
jgi:preprotein translocase subunit SecD